MRGYLSPIGAGTGQIPVDERTEIYRDPEAEQNAALVAEKEGRKISLGVSDVTVSRKKNGVPPVLLMPKENFIEVHNNNNANCVVVKTSSKKKEIDEGFVETIQTDAELCLGYNAEFRLTVETVAEVTKIGNVEGDYVGGDKKVENVDQSTEVGSDAVVNRLNTHNDEREGVVGDEDIDDSDTVKFCEVHDIHYKGDICPECGSGR